MASYYASMIKSNQSVLSALRFISVAIIEACAAAGHTGVPGGILYAALASKGCTLEQFTGIMSGLVNAGFLRKDGDCYFATGREIVPVAPPVASGMAPRGWDSISAGREVQS